MSTDRLELILDVATEGFWDWDLTADLAYLSPRYCELTGYSPEDTVFDSAFYKKLIHPDDQAHVFNIIGEHLQGKRGSSIIEYRMISKDGTMRWIEGRGKIVEYDDQGRPVRMVGTILDITSRKQEEAEKVKLIGELRTALDEVKTLRGIIPICASCKNIRDDGGYWNQIESYIARHSEASFSHSICPDCAKKLYPELMDDDGNWKE